MYIRINVVYTYAVSVSLPFCAFSHPATEASVSRHDTTDSKESVHYSEYMHIRNSFTCCIDIICYHRVVGFMPGSNGHRNHGLP